LLDAGADVNARDKDGYSALMYAALKADEPSALQILLDAGADVSFKDVFDDTAAIIIKDNSALANEPIAAKLSE
jgi:ankyrin repeat protein